MRYDEAFKMKCFLLNDEDLDLYSNLCGVRVHQLTVNEIEDYRKRGAKCYGKFAIRIIRYSRVTHDSKDIEYIREFCDLTHFTFRDMYSELRDIRKEAIERTCNHKQ